MLFHPPRIHFHTPATACRVCVIAHAPTAAAEFLSRVIEKIMISYSSIRDRVVDTTVFAIQWACVVALLYVVVILHNRAADGET